MKKHVLLDTSDARMIDLRHQIDKAIPFLVRNAKMIALSEGNQKLVEQTRVYTSSPCGDVFTHIMSSPKVTAFKFLDFTNFGEDIPDVFTLNDFSIDAKYLQPPAPAGFEGLWVNLTPILARRKNRDDLLRISDIPRLTQLVTRGALVMSYHDSDGWLTPKLAAFVIETYAHSTTSLLRQLYNLDLDEQKFVKTWFAAYYAQLLGPSDADTVYPPLLNRCGFLGSISEITMRLNDGMTYLKETYNSTELTPKLVIEVLVKYGPTRFSTLTYERMRRMFAASATDSITMAVALEYPPYWVFQILKTLSGDKNPVITNHMITMGMKQQLVKFYEELLVSESFIGAIKR